MRISGPVGFPPSVPGITSNDRLPHHPASWTEEDVAALIYTDLGADASFVGSIVSGLFLRIEGAVAVINGGLKSEGCIPLRYFASTGDAAELHAGDRIDILAERYGGPDGGSS
jgi:ribosomal protein S1